MSISVEKLVLGDIATNTYIVTDSESGECAVVDPAEENEYLLSKLKDKNVVYILLTHGHFDHISGVNYVKKLTGAAVVIHNQDAECLSDGLKSLFIWQYPDKVQPKITPDIITEDGDKIILGSTEITVMHTPGHTKGGCCYVFSDDGIIFSGDTLFRLSAGRTDFLGGSAREILHSLSRLADLPGDYKVYPGHDEETTLEYERQNNRYMRKHYAHTGD